MTSLTPCNPQSHARQLRHLTTLLSSTPPTFPSSPPPFHSLDSQTLSPLLNSLLPLLSHPPTLPLLISLLSSAPPALLIPHLLPIAQKITPFLKPSHSPTSRARAFTAISTLLRHPALSVQDRLISTQSAVTHAVRTLQEPETSHAPLLLSAIAVLLTVLFVAPRELRAEVTAIEAILPSLFVNPLSEVRYASTALWSQIIVTAPKAAFQQKFEERLGFIMGRLADVHALLDGLAEGGMKGVEARVHADLKGLGGREVGWYYQTMCKALGALIGIEGKVYMPLAEMVHVLVGALAWREVDIYGNLEGVKMDADGALELGEVVVREALEILRNVLRTIGNVMLPYVGVVGSVLERRLMRELVRFRNVGGVVACTERGGMYRVLEEGIEVWGGVFVERFLSLFVEVFEMEVAFYRKCVEGGKRKVEKVKALEGGRRKKRRRGKERGEVTVEIRLGEKERLEGAVGAKVMSEVQEVVDDGLGVCIAVFENRGVLNEKAVVAMEKLEGLLERLAQGTMTDQLLEAMRAAALGGGASRLRAEASPLLMVSAAKAREIIVAGGRNGRKVAFQTRSACEAVFHPRGPPVLKAIVQNVILEGAEEISAEEKRQTELPNGLGSGEHDIVPMVTDIGDVGDINSRIELEETNAAIGSTSALGVTDNGTGIREKETEENYLDPSLHHGDSGEANDKSDKPKSSLSPKPSQALAAMGLPLGSHGDLPKQRNISWRDENGNQDSNPDQATSPIIQKTNIEKHKQPEKQGVLPHAVDKQVFENKPATLFKNGRNVDGEHPVTSEAVTTEADEKVLIASLRFEPSDEE